ncbi:MAG: hypothetical protein DHS20C18_53680 [Saprospiraceae bacterium]|nr:MAG: hypothetical protein DHS20C18_53680 [Saprospiraceae bacterium]
MQLVMSEVVDKILVIFDIDGTLVYSNRVDSQCFADAYQTIYRRKFPSIDWQRYPHVTDTTIFDAVIHEHFQRPSDPEEVRLFQDAFVRLILEKRDTEPEAFQEVPGARQAVLNLLEHPGYEVGIATGGWERPARVKLTHVAIPHEQINFRGADGLIRREDIIQHVIDRSVNGGSRFRKIVYIGDAIWDVQTTRNMQLDFIGIRREGDAAVLQEAGADQVLVDYGDFEGFCRAVAVARPPDRGED